ncbi:MAG: M24 family metallopeptidase, partial [Patescibacteria group bacterium]
MIHIKTPEEIKIMAEGGKILADVLFAVLDKVAPGVSEIELDRLADELIIKKGGFPGFKKVRGYKYATCISTNDVVVHGIPTNYV